MENDFCVACEVAPVHVRKWLLCRNCYSKCRKEGYIKDMPIFPKPSRSRDSMIRKYGQEIVSDFEKLADIHCGSLTTIGEKYGFTRERARQIFEILFGFKYKVFVSNRAATLKNRKRAEYIKRKDPREKIKRYADGLPKKGAEGEARVFNICSSLNYEIKAYAEDASIDLVINGFLVDVKTAYKTTVTGRSSRTPLYHFQRSDKQASADFFICHAVPINKFFIIPQSQWGKTKHIYIPEKKVMTWEGCCGKQTRVSRWYQYEDAWGLLKTETVNTVLNEKIYAVK